MLWKRLRAVSTKTQDKLMNDLDIIFSLRLCKTVLKDEDISEGRLSVKGHHEVRSWCGEDGMSTSVNKCVSLANGNVEARYLLAGESLPVHYVYRYQSHSSD